MSGIIDPSVKWITANYTWIFSGIGVAMLVAGYEWLRRRNKGRGTVLNSLVNVSGSTITGSTLVGRDVIQTIHVTREISHPIEGEYSPTPTANEIRQQIYALPLLQQPAARRSYVGLRVKWPAQIENLHQSRSKDGIVGVSMRYGDESWGATLYGEVELDKYPRLKSIYDGERVKVMGTIGEVQTGVIWLDLIRLEFGRK